MASQSCGSLNDTHKERKACACMGTFAVQSLSSAWTGIHRRFCLPCLAETYRLAMQCFTNSEHQWVLIVPWSQVCVGQDCKLGLISVQHMKRKNSMGIV